MNIVCILQAKYKVGSSHLTIVGSFLKIHIMKTKAVKTVIG